MRACGVSERGNTISDPQGEFGIAQRALPRACRSIRWQPSCAGAARKWSDALERDAAARLRAARALRPRPHLDDKMIVSWNGLMISAAGARVPIAGTAPGPRGRARCADSCAIAVDPATQDAPAPLSATASRVRRRSSTTTRSWRGAAGPLRRHLRRSVAPVGWSLAETMCRVVPRPARGDSLRQPADPQCWCARRSLRRRRALGQRARGAGAAAALVVARSAGVARAGARDRDARPGRSSSGRRTPCRRCSRRSTSCWPSRCRWSSRARPARRRPPACSRPYAGGSCRIASCWPPMAGEGRRWLARRLPFLEAVEPAPGSRRHRPGVPALRLRAAGLDAGSPGRRARRAIVRLLTRDRNPSPTRASGNTLYFPPGFHLT